MPGIPMNLPLAALPLPFCPPQTSPGGNILTTPLPMVLFPLPLDPLCPPAVLPFYRSGASESSGYSTTGDSRSSSPMLPPSSAAHFCLNEQELSIKPNKTLSNATQFASSCNSSPSSLSPNSGSGGSNTSQTNPHQLNFSAPFPPNVVYEAPSTEITILSHFPTVPGQFVVYFHINPGVNVNFNVGDHVQIIKGPMTVPLVSTNSTNPPIPLPMQVPPGHVVQQIVDESGTLRHVIVSHQPPLMSIPSHDTIGTNQAYLPPGSYPVLGAIQRGFGTHPRQGSSSTSAPSTVCGLISPSCNGGIPQPSYFKRQTRVDQEGMKEELPNYLYQNGGYIGREETGNNNNNNIVSGGNLSNGDSKAGKSVATGNDFRNVAPIDENRRLLALTEILSNIAPPVVSEITRRSALIKWAIPHRWADAGANKDLEFDVSNDDICYEVFIADRSRTEICTKSIFLGTALSCFVKDLKPGASYVISYRAIVEAIKGNNSAPAIFTTLPGEPDAPSPRAITRNRNSLTFKWNAPNDNGSKIIAYILEYDEGKGGCDFVEAYKGKSKQCTISRLQPAYSYQFRLAAINEAGQSRFSPAVTVITAGNPPAQPRPPTLTESGVTYLTLEWNTQHSDDEYSLQMEDPTSGHGFLGAYSGNCSRCTCDGLKKYTEYKFRVKASNGEGHSKWSDEVVFRTLPDRPLAPQKPTIKGKPHSFAFKVKWDPPLDTGGVPLSAYSVQIDEGNGDFREIYRGQEEEFLVNKLSPGASYRTRVVAIGPGGESEPSEPCTITTEPVCPGKCDIPRVVGKAKSNSVHLKWSPPDFDGGSALNSYEVGCTTADNFTQEAYRGIETNCYVNGLLPGRSYLFQIRAYNRVGAGFWSDSLELISGPGVPDPPSAPKATCKSPHSVAMSWTEPLNNGAAVTEYRLQMAYLLPPTHYSSPSNSSSDAVNSSSSSFDVFCHGDIADANDPEKMSDIDCQEIAIATRNCGDLKEMVSTFTQVYLGPNIFCEVKNLQPVSTYLFRLQASNSVGCSEWSAVTTHITASSSPSQVTQLESNSTSATIALKWAIPASNGSPILHYNVMVGESVLISCNNSYILDDLMPDTNHKIRVQAVNAIGPGAASALLKVATKPLCPAPPKLELVANAHFWLKLKWAPEALQKNTEYILQMINPFQDEFQVVYRGTVPNCKINRLMEDTIYQFRISAINSAGQGQFSDLFHFSTSKAPPPQVKGLTVVMTEEVHFDWSTVNCSGIVTYQLQIAKQKEQAFKVVYRGECRNFSYKSDSLDRGVEYIARVCALRRLEDGSQLVGAYSRIISFTPPVELRCSSTALLSPSFTSNLTTTAQVLEEKLNRISYESKVGLMAVIALVLLAFTISLITHHAVS